MRRAHGIDGNHHQVVAALRALGAHVVDTAGVGGGFPDLLVVWRGRTMLIEIKDGSLEPARRKLKPAQVTFHAGYPGEIHVVESVEEAVKLLDGASHA